MEEFAMVIDSPGGFWKMSQNNKNMSIPLPNPLGEPITINIMMILQSWLFENIQEEILLVLVVTESVIGTGTNIIPHCFVLRFIDENMEEKTLRNCL